jgi:hypothetical protein
MGKTVPFSPLYAISETQPARNSFYIQINFFYGLICHIRLAEVTRVGADLPRFLFQICLDLRDHRQQLLFVVRFLRNPGALLHGLFFGFLLDHDGYVPSFVVVTDVKYGELKMARSLHLEAGTILAIDRGYNDYKWFSELTRDGIFFVTRMKTNTVYETVELCEIQEKGHVLSDQIVSMPTLNKDGEEPILFRRIEYWSADKQEILVFFTNLLHLAASIVAAIYKDRWQIELFFEALKQAAKVKSFLGTSANAVTTQI